MIDVSLAPIQASLVNIGNLFAFDFAFKSSNQKKFDQIFSALKEERHKSDRFYDFLERMADLCKCHEHRQTRFRGYEKTVDIITCPTNKD